MVEPNYDTVVSGRELRPEDLIGHTAALRRLALLLLHDETEADDAVQNVLLAALEKPPADEVALGPWLNGVLRNKVRQRRRRDAIQGRVYELLEHGRESWYERADEVSERDAHTDTLQALYSLNEPYRKALVHKFLHQKTSRQIAQESGVTVSTVTTRVQRGVQSLRTRLRRKYGEFVPCVAVVMLGGPEGVDKMLKELGPHGAPGGLAGAAGMAGSKVKFAAAMALAPLLAWAAWETVLDPQVDAAQVAGVEAGAEEAPPPGAEPAPRVETLEGVRRGAGPGPDPAPEAAATQATAAPEIFLRDREQERITPAGEGVEGLQEHDFGILLTRAAVADRIELPVKASDVRYLGLSLLRTSSEAAEAGAIGYLEDPPPPPFHLTLVYGGFALDRRYVAEARDFYELTLDRHELRTLQSGLSVTVVEAGSGDARADAVVEVDRHLASLTGTSAAGAGFELVELPPGPAVVQITAPGMVRQVQRVELPPGGVLELGTIVLTPEARVAGVLLDAFGAPVAATSVFVCDLGDKSGAPRFDFHLTARTDAEGRFVLRNLPRSRLVLAIEDARGQLASRPMLVDTRYGSIADVELQAVPATTLQLSSALRETEVRELVVRHASTGLPVWSQTLIGRKPRRELNLPAGEYLLETYDGGTEPVRSVDFKLSTIPLTLPVLR